MQFRPGKADPVVETMVDGSQRESTLKELSLDRWLALESWRKKPSDGAKGLHVVQLFLMNHTAMPADLQDWLSDCLELSRSSFGAISLDIAFGIKDPGTKENAYNEAQTKGIEAHCIGVMEMLIEGCGIKSKALAARLVKARDCPEFSASSLERYYRNYERKDSEVRDQFRAAFFPEIQENGDTQLEILETFLPSAGGKDNKALAKVMREIRLALPLRKPD